MPNTSLSFITQLTKTLSRKVLLLALFIVPATLATENTFFKITNEQGRIELKSTITPKEAKRGYKIVTLGGHVVKEVPAELSAEEYAELSDELRRARETEKNKKAEQNYNESLLLRYSSLDDLEAEKARKLNEFDIRISILKSNQLGLQEKLSLQQARAANIERSGQAAPKYILKNIREIEAEMRESESAINARQKEKEQIDKQYSEDAARLDKLIKRYRRD